MVPHISQTRNRAKNSRFAFVWLISVLRSCSICRDHSTKVYYVGTLLPNQVPAPKIAQHPTFLKTSLRFRRCHVYVSYYSLCTSFPAFASSVSATSSDSLGLGGGLVGAVLVVVLEPYGRVVHRGHRGRCRIMSVAIRVVVLEPLRIMVRCLRGGRARCTCRLIRCHPRRHPGSVRRRRSIRL